MADLFAGIGRKKFAVFGRVGMDLFPTPPGTKTRITSDVVTSPKLSETSKFTRLSA